MVSKKNPSNSKLILNGSDDKNNVIFLKPGTVLNSQYLIEKPIFKSFNFISYLAFDNHLNTKIIVKEFFPNNLVTRLTDQKVVALKLNSTQLFEKYKTKFMEIFTILKKFSVNPSTIRIFSIFTYNNTCYCVQELPKGITLKKFLSNNYGELHWQKAKPMFLELLNFLSNLHDNKIVHCGLSPETLLVQNNTLKIIDYSSAILDENKTDLKIKLHDGYSAIEQYGTKKIGTFTDVYSIAAVLYKSLTGTRPVSSNSRFLNDNLLPPKNLNKNVPKNISVSIMSALILSSKLRTQTVSDFCADLTANSRNSNEFMLNFSDVAKNVDDNLIEHINTIEPIKPSRKGRENIHNRELKTHSLVFIAMLISASTVLFTAAIIIFILFNNSFF